MVFSSTNQPLNNGRPKGSLNKRGKISQSMTDKAMAALDAALEMNEPWAIQEVIKRTHPTLKAVTPNESLDGELLLMKIKEINEFEQRLIALEKCRNG